MSYTTGGITILGSHPYDLGRIISAVTTHTDKYIQCYVSGRLVSWQQPRHGAVQFILAELVEEDTVFLLAVDPADAQTDYFAEAFETSSENGNRFIVQSPQLISPFAPNDKWKIYRGENGDESATIPVHHQEFYPGGRHSGGWGKSWGYGGWGWSGFDCAGWGNNWGYGEWGFDCEMLTWTSDPLSSGTYPIKVIAEDTHGNESAAYETTVTLTTYPQPASEAAVSSYQKETDTLVLTFTGSEDFD